MRCPVSSVEPLQAQWQPGVGESEEVDRERAHAEQGRGLYGGLVGGGRRHDARRESGHAARARLVRFRVRVRVRVGVRARVRVGARIRARARVRVRVNACSARSGWPLSMGSAAKVLEALMRHSCLSSAPREGGARAKQPALPAGLAPPPG